jgi:lipopolysaccharide export system ATP-binding protein
MATLKVSDLMKRYRGRRVVDGVSLELSSNSIVGLLGPNGAGKTTTFYMIAGLIRPDQGAVLLDGEDVTRLPMHQRARRGITYLPQETSVFRKLSVADNIRLVLETRGLARQESDARTRELLEDMGLSALANQQAQSLSGGERRRVEVLRSLATDPEFILLDEPFAGVDPLAVSDLQDIIKGLKARGIGVVISDHNVRETLTVCDRAYILNLGTVMEEGTPEHITASSVARKIYLGEDFTL